MKQSDSSILKRWLGDDDDEELEQDSENSSAEDMNSDEHGLSDI